MMHNPGGLSTMFNKYIDNIKNLWIAISRQDKQIADLKVEIFQLKLRLKEFENNG
jgi:hypothetical protein